MFLELETSSIYWDQLSRFLPEDGDRIQPPKRWVLKKKTGRFLDREKTIDNVQKRNICTYFS
jgi:hypothetical protein